MLSKFSTVMDLLCCSLRMRHGLVNHICMRFKKFCCIVPSTLYLRRLAYAFLLLGVAYFGLLMTRSEFNLINDAGRIMVAGPACKLPHLDINDPAIMKFVKEQGPLTCDKVQNWVQMNGSTARITEEARKNFGFIECNFTDIIRRSDNSTYNGVTTQTHTEYNLEETDFVKVNCISEKGNTWHNVMAGVRQDQDILDQTGWDKVPEDGLHLNVLMWGFDSLSRNMFARKLPRSVRYLRKTLGAFELHGYNIVGDGTPQALIPILTGKTELELPETRKRMRSKAKYVNIYPFSWKDFKANGYVTAFAEDNPYIAMFNYRLKGFDSPPTDHYMRPFYLEVSQVYDKHPKYCLGSIPKHKVLMNYVHDFFEVYRNKPKFLLAFHSELSHDSINLIGAADEDFQQWLQIMYEEGHLNSTLLIVMADHGHRFTSIRNTLQGKQEERLPMFSFVLPQWFIQEHPEAVKNLRFNTERLTSPFDIYATLMNVLHFEGPGTANLQNRSCSLFKEIPESRTCADAFIEPHWCACLDWQPVSLSDKTVLNAARAAIEYINKISEERRDLCIPLYLESVLGAARLVPTQGVLNFRKNADHDGFKPDMSDHTKISQEIYQLKLLAQPGDALYEVSMKHKVKEELFFVEQSDISRISKYAPFTWCLGDTFLHLRKYCFCRGTVLYSI